MTAAEHLARAYLKLAAIERDSGHEAAAQAYEAAADLAGATCPHCGGDLVGSFPVTGVEVDVPHDASAVLAAGQRVAQAAFNTDAGFRGTPLTPAQQIRNRERPQHAPDDHEET